MNPRSDAGLAYEVICSLTTCMPVFSMAVILGAIGVAAAADVVAAVAADVVAAAAAAATCKADVLLLLPLLLWLQLMRPMLLHGRGRGGEEFHTVVYQGLGF